jgi:3-oxoacyl-(acyl-carrier-protein) synthase
METHMSIPKFNNTRARKVYETILKAIGISSSQRSKALAHSPSVAKVNYIKTLVKNFTDQDKTEIIGFFKKLKTGK